MIVCANTAVGVFYKTRKIFRGIFMTKRIFALVFVLLFALSFAACIKNGDRPRDPLRVAIRRASACLILR